MKRKRMRQLAKLSVFIVLASLILPSVQAIESERATIPRGRGAGIEVID